MSKLSKGLKGIRRALKLPPITAGNVLTKYAPAAAQAYTGQPPTALWSGGGGSPRTPDFSRGFTSGPSGAPGRTPSPTFPGGSRTGGGSDRPWWQDALAGIGDLAGSAGSFVKNNAVDIGIGGLAAYQALNSANASKRAGQLQDKAISGAEKRWGDNEALRTEGRRRLLNPTRPDLSSVYADPTNPFAKRATPTAPSDATPGIPIGAALGKLSGYARPSIPIAQRLGKKLLASGALQPNTPIADRMGVDILASGALGGGGGIANKIANARKRLLPAPY